ncbi:MAG: hypothetical protein ACREA0_22105, partial [bacterium]
MGAGVVIGGDVRFHWNLAGISRRHHPAAEQEQEPVAVLSGQEEVVDGANDRQISLVAQIVHQRQDR